MLPDKLGDLAGGILCIVVLISADNFTSRSKRVLEEANPMQAEALAALRAEETLGLHTHTHTAQYLNTAQISLYTAISIPHSLNLTPLPS